MNKNYTIYLLALALSSLNTAFATSNAAPAQQGVVSGKVVALGTAGALVAYGFGELCGAYKTARKHDTNLTFVNFLKDKKMLKTYLLNKQVGNRAALATTGLIALGAGAQYLNKANGTSDVPPQSDEVPTNRMGVKNMREFQRKAKTHEMRELERQREAERAEEDRRRAEREAAAAAAANGGTTPLP
jgi:hypothetical protein